MMTGRFPEVGTYHVALLNYVLSSDENGLTHAYELGRLGLRAGCGLLYMLHVHEQALSQILDRTRTEGEVRTRVQAASRFLIEALSPFGMATDAYRDLVNVR